MRTVFVCSLIFIVGTLRDIPLTFAHESTVASETLGHEFDVVVVGGTPSGIMASIAAARHGKTVALLCRYQHIGGLLSNGLTKTDCSLPEATQGLFREFKENIASHYTDTYGEDSPQAKLCNNGLHFEPSIGKAVLLKMLGKQKDRITVLTLRQFDAEPQNVMLESSRLLGIYILNLASQQRETYLGKVFIDATYEGDLAAAAGTPYRLGREGRSELGEVTAGVIYQPWRGKVAEGSTGLADNAVQAYNYRICMTKDPADRYPIRKPDTYNRAEYVSLIDDLKQDRRAGKVTDELEPDGIGFIVNAKPLPNGKYDANNQHAAFLSTDLPEENWPWPTASWTWRDHFARRLRDYNLGLIWFAQHDQALPEDFRKRCLEWGLSKSEFLDNDHFPREVYVREGRRIEGEYLFTLHDSLSKRGMPEHAASITAWKFNADSHAVRKRELGRPHLDGFHVYSTRPCCIPYGTIVPKKIDGLLVPVAVSATHVGFRVIRMEPCWMALGQAAGTAAALSIDRGETVRKLNVVKLQKQLLQDGAVLIYFQDIKPTDRHFEALQFCALNGVMGELPWKADLTGPIGQKTATQWLSNAKLPHLKAQVTAKMARGELLSLIYQALERTN